MKLALFKSEFPYGTVPAIVQHIQPILDQHRVNGIMEYARNLSGDSFIIVTGLRQLDVEQVLALITQSAARGPPT